MEFRWNDWSLEHVGRHGVTQEEAEEVVGRFLQVIFLLDDEETAYVIHARPLTEQEKRRYRRSRR